jgi:hypothetical protein
MRIYYFYFFPLFLKGKISYIHFFINKRLVLLMGGQQISVFLTLNIDFKVSIPNLHIPIVTDVRTCITHTKVNDMTDSQPLLFSCSVPSTPKVIFLNVFAVLLLIQFKISEHCSALNIWLLLRKKSPLRFRKALKISDLSFSKANFGMKLKISYCSQTLLINLVCCLTRNPIGLSPTYLFQKSIKNIELVA